MEVLLGHRFYAANGAGAAQLVMFANHRVARYSQFWFLEASNDVVLTGAVP